MTCPEDSSGLSEISECTIKINFSDTEEFD